MVAWVGLDGSIAARGYVGGCTTYGGKERYVESIRTVWERERERERERDKERWVESVGPMRERERARESEREIWRDR